MKLIQEGIARNAINGKIFLHYLILQNYIFDPTIVRGLEYYTGPIFEANLTFGVQE